MPELRELLNCIGTEVNWPAMDLTGTVRRGSAGFAASTGLAGAVYLDDKTKKIVSVICSSDGAYQAFNEYWAVNENNEIVRRKR